jgi:tetratricopeptide (TPR) repeat protein
LEELVAQGQPTHELARQAADYFEQLTVESVGPAAQRSSDTARFSAVAAARLRLRYGDRDFAPAERVLTAALRAADDAADEVPGAWRAEARVLLVYALAGQGKWPAARDALEQVPSASARRLVVMIERLVELGDTADAADRREVAELVFRAVVLIESSAPALNETDARSVALSRARALVAAGRSAEALKAYDALVEALPGDGDVQEARASLLTTEGDARALESALVAWRGVEKKSALAGERWFRARLAQADVYHRLGQDDRAAKLIKLTRTLHPDLGGTAMRSKFLALLAQCE